MDVSVSVSLFQDELASTIEHAVKAALNTVLCAITKAVRSKFTEFQVEMAGKEKENESLKLTLEISESELKAVRGCINAADADIKQPLIFQVDSEVVLTQSMVVKKDALSKRHYRTTIIMGVVIQDKRFLRCVGETLEFRWLPRYPTRISKSIQ
ncbi:UNVERIFIED_CONTAM: hypothetical protein FKN15_031602 [Acipenser sinensis]